jgi:putative tryptophan/tyrosine transport system substrate-binding protein
VRRRDFITLLGGAAAAWPLAARAQQQIGSPRVGYFRLSPTARMQLFDDAFREGLRDLGYVEGKNSASFSLADRIEAPAKSGYSPLA